MLFLERSHPSVDHRHVDRVLANLERREFRNNELHAMMAAGDEGGGVGGSRTNLSMRRMGLRHRASAAKSSVSKTLLGRTSKKSRKVAPVKEGSGDQQSDEEHGDGWRLLGGGSLRARANPTQQLRQKTRAMDPP